MPAIPDLTLRNYNIQERIGFSTIGGAQKEFVVTFHAGIYGPYSLTFKSSEATPLNIKKEVDAFIARLRETFNLLAQVE